MQEMPAEKIVKMLTNARGRNTSAMMTPSVKTLLEALSVIVKPVLKAMVDSAVMSMNANLLITGYSLIVLS